MGHLRRKRDSQRARRQDDDAAKQTHRLFLLQRKDQQRRRFGCRLGSRPLRRESEGNQIIMRMNCVDFKLYFFLNNEVNAIDN